MPLYNPTNNSSSNNIYNLNGIPTFISSTETYNVYNVIQLDYLINIDIEGFINLDGFILEV